MHTSINDWIEKSNTFEELMNYVRKKSRSNFPEEVRECANFAKNMLERIDLEVDLIETSGNPLIVGKKSGDPSKPKILIYGHYDVQHEGDEDLWHTKPFEPVIKANKMFGRGTGDNKGQHFAHIKALEYLKIHHSELFDDLNLIFVLDGDEERGSFSLAEVFDQGKVDFDADLFIVSDGPSFVEDRPSIIGGVRGILTFQITIKNNEGDLHSGNFGGLARSANLDIVNLLSDMIDKNGMAKIPGFYDDILEPNSKQKSLLKELEPLFDTIQDEMKFQTAKIIDDKSKYEQNQFLPTININGIASGGVKDERRTIIPSETVVSLDCRLVPNMRTEKIKKLIESFVKSWSQKNQLENHLSIDFEHAMEPTRNSLSSPYLEDLINAFSFGFGSEPLIVPTLGGSLPLYLFEEYLNKEVFLIPLALPDENNHAPNENLDLPYFKKGVASMIKLYELILQ